jgi:hypothetical protein
MRSEANPLLSLFPITTPPTPLHHCPLTSYQFLRYRLSFKADRQTIPTLFFHCPFLSPTQSVQKPFLKCVKPFIQPIYQLTATLRNSFCIVTVKVTLCFISFFFKVSAEFCVDAQNTAL